MNSLINRLPKMVAALLITGVLISVFWVMADIREPLLNNIDIAGDQNGSFYSLCSDGNRKYIQAVDAKGRLLYKTELSRNKRTVYYDYGFVAVDKNANCYVTIEEQNLKNGVYTQYVQKLDRRGKKTDILFTIDHDKALSSDASSYRILDFSVYDDTVVLVQTNADNNALFKKTYYIETGEYSTTFYEFEKETEIYGALATPTGEMYYVDSVSALHSISYLGEYEKIELPESVVPVTLSSDEKGTLYFTDGHNMAFYAYNPESKSLREIYGVASRVTESEAFENLRHFKYSNGAFIGTLAPWESKGNSFIAVDQKTNITVSETTLSIGSILLRFLWRFVFTAAVLMTVSILLYGFFYARKLIIKLLLIMIPSVFIMITAIYFYGRTMFSEMIIREAKSQLTVISTFIISGIDAEDFNNAPFGRQADSKNKNMVQKVYEYIKASPQSGEKRIFATVYGVKDGVSYVVTDYPYEGAPKQAGTRESYYRQPDSAYLLTTTDIYADGVKKGYVEIGMNPEYIEQQVIIQTWTLIVPVCLFICLITSSLFIVTGRALKGLKELNKAVADMTEGDFNARADIRTKDEFEDIGNAFNKMSYRIRKYFDSLSKLNEAYEKFVPNKIFHMLGRDNILDVKLNDHTQTSIASVSISIDNYFEMEKGKDATEKFNFITTLFSSIVSILNHTGGTVERFYNTGVTAIYDSVEDAILASLGILDCVGNDEATRDISIRVMVQSCEATVGIVGDSYRMSTAVFFDNNDFNEKLANFMKTTGIKLLITEETYHKASYSERYTFRLAGEAVSGERKIKLYDVIESYRFGERQNKLITMESFESAVNHFIANDFYQARKKFISILKIDPQDEAAKAYVFKCDYGAENRRIDA